MSTIYADYAIDLAVDVSAIFLMAYVLYFRRHRRADLLLAYVTLNIGCSRSCRSSGCGPAR